MPYKEIYSTQVDHKKKHFSRLQDAHNAFGKALGDFVTMCEEEKKVSVHMEKNFGPFYILTGAYPQDLATGQLISAWKTN